MTKKVHVSGKRAGECDLCDTVVLDLWSHYHNVHGVEYESRNDNRPLTLCVCYNPKAKSRAMGQCEKCGRLISEFAYIKDMKPALP
jgi:hypothetical protein